MGGLTRSRRLLPRAGALVVEGRVERIADGCTCTCGNRRLQPQRSVASSTAIAHRQIFDPILLPLRIVRWLDDRLQHPSDPARCKLSRRRCSDARRVSGRPWALRRSRRACRCRSGCTVVASVPWLAKVLVIPRHDWERPLTCGLWEHVAGVSIELRGGHTRRREHL